MSLGKICLDDIILSFRKQKEFAEKAFQQVKDEDFFKQPGEHSNSIAVIMKHVAGNLASRWTEFLTTDGDKPWRDRDAEFVIGADDSRAEPSYGMGERLGGFVSQLGRSPRTGPIEEGNHPQRGTHGPPGHPSLFDPHRLSRRPNRLSLPVADYGRLEVDHDSTRPEPAGQR